MQLSNRPGKLVLPFAASGNKNGIPVTSQIGITPGAASLADGFPPLTMTPVTAGGVPPSGLDMNGILYEMSAVVRWANAGGGYPFDSDFASDTNVGGYPKGARVLRADGSGYWFNTVDGNTTDPDSGAAADWVPDFTTGAVVVPMASANVTLTPVQYGKPIIVITGLLTSNLNLIFPDIDGQWVLINKTTGGYNITAKTAAGTGIQTQGGNVVALVGDATDIYTFGSNKNQFFVSARNFITTAVDGTTSNQAGIEAVVAYAYAIGAQINWDAGTYVSTANIPHFHDITHTGPGVIKRGSDTWLINGKTGTHNLYVATTGNNNNDGLTATLPRLTIQSAFDALGNWSDALLRNGIFKVQLAAGTYTAETYVFGLRSRNSISVQGPSVGGSPNVPTAIIDGTTPGSRGILLYFQGYMNVSVQDVKLQNVTATGTALEFDYHCVGWMNNVHIWNGGYNGVQASVCSRVAMTGGIIDTCQYGFNAYGYSTVTVGYGGAAGAVGTNNRPLIKNCTTAGVWFAGGFGHIDYCDLQNNARNIYLTNVSRAHVMGCACSGASVADVECEGASTWYNDTTITNTFSSTRNFAHGGGCFEQGSDSYKSQYDKTNNRFKWGGNAIATPQVPFHFEYSVSGISPNSNTRMFVDSAADNLITLAAGASNSVGLAFAKAGGANLEGELYYYFPTSRIYFRSSDADQYTMDSGGLQPVSDNARTLGSVSTRWSVVYAGTGTINTSDEREKTFSDITGTETKVALELKKLIRKFQFNDAIAEKGADGARYHFGVGAQSVAEVFKKYKLDPSKYALFCYDEWPEQEEIVETWPDELDEEGNVIREAGSRVVEPYRAAGNRFGIRYDELLCFIVGAM